MVFYALCIVLITHAVMSSAEVSNDNLLKFSKSNNKVASDLYSRLIKRRSSNICFCPASIMTGLGIMLIGARDNTNDELRSVLGYETSGLQNEKIPETFYDMFTMKIPEDFFDSINFILTCADDVFITSKAKLDEAFLKTANSQYVSNVTNVNFDDTEKVVNDINTSVREHTYNKIKHIVRTIKAGLTVLAIDVVYFKGRWATSFPSQLTSPQEFHGESGSSSEVKTVPFMHNIYNFPYYEDGSFQAIFLPYVEGNMGMLILLPQQQNDFQNFESTMTTDKILEVMTQLSPTNVSTSIPKFKCSFYQDFTKLLKSRAKSVYDGSGNFSGMTSYNESLAVKGPLHKARIDVDEGDQSAVKPSFEQSEGMKEFKADHSFMFAVVHKEYHMLLFVGRVKKL